LWVGALRLTNLLLGRAHFRSEMGTKANQPTQVDRFQVEGRGRYLPA
jgi:hypothetical protein